MELVRKGMRVYERHGLFQLGLSASFVVDEVIFASTIKCHLHPRVRELKYRIQYGRSAPRAAELIHVDPTTIEWIIAPRLHVRSDVTKYGTSILAGDWDRKFSDHQLSYLGTWENVKEQTLVHVRNFGLYTAAKAHIEEGIPWQETDLYSYFIRNSKSRENDRRYGSARTIDRRLSELDRLYRHINNHGYLRQSELEADEDIPFAESADQFAVAPWQNEVMVAIGRDGEILFNEGRHRFVIARILGLDSIPVRVIARHREWQTVRNRVVQGTTSPYPHPDLVGLPSGQ